MKDYEEKADKLVTSALRNIKDEDILHRGFLKPYEIALKTYKTQPNNARFKPGALAKGLKIAVRQNLSEDKRTFHNFQIIDRNVPYEELKKNNQDNILSMMKKETGIKLAICVCMYSEDKKMLKSTLSGVADNIANLVAYEKMSPDEIGVFVMMDGIEKVDPSVIDYFEELQRSSNINLGDNIVPSLTMDQIADRAMNMTEQEIDELQIKNVNNYLFDVAELDERNCLRFAAVRQAYDEIKDLLKQIKHLKQKKIILFQELPDKIKPYFFQQAKLLRFSQYAESEEDYKQEFKKPNAKAEFEQKLHDDYALNMTKAKPLILKALQEGERFCNNFIATRQDLAYVSCFRKKIPFSFEALQKSQGQRGNREQIYEDQIEERSKYTVMNLYMCVKYKNAGKLSSHNWFFNGFCQELKPQYAILLDVGLRPYEQALMKMYRYLHKNPRTDNDGGVGGVCGYMSLKIEKIDGEQEVKDEEIDFLTGITSKFTDIQRTQQVEYHFAHLMDKGFEAAFGFIHVLPGAFSAYNMKAVINYEKDEDDQLLKEYFKSIDQKIANRKVVKSEMSIGNALLRTCLPDFINSCFINIDPESDEQMLYSENVYLAEDRILCMGIHKKGYDMKYLPDAYAQVDPIKTVHGLLGQRKRWINGSYFAFEKVKKELKAHQQKNGCQFFLNLQIFYLSLMNGLSYFAPAFFLFTVHIAMDAFRSDVLVNVLQNVVTGDSNKSQVFMAFTYTMDFIYVLLIMTIVFLSLHLTNRHKRFVPYIYGVSTLFGLFMVCVFLVLIVDIFRGLLTDNTAFLIQNAALIGNIPGGFTTINLMRWLLVSSVLIYIIPISTYIILFGRLHILCEIIMGAFSFLFFGPTYLNILNIYSLCRIDDISWGTKGLDSGSDKNANLKDSWKLIKFVHVVKYVVWNVILGVVLLTLGASYIPRFFVTIIMVCLIGVSMSVKVVLACVYMLVYWCKYHTKEGTPTLTYKSSIDDMLKKYEGDVMAQVKDNLQGVKREYMKNPTQMGSFIQASRRGDKAKNDFKKQKELQKGKSGVYRKLDNKKFGKATLPTIQEETIQKKNALQKKEQKKAVNSSGDLLDQSDSSNADKPLAGLKNQPKGFVDSPEKLIPKASSEEFQAVPKGGFDKSKFKKQSKK